MRKLFGLVFGVAALLPLPSLADDLTSYQGFGTQPNTYISNDQYLIHIDHDGSDITGQVWENGAWTTPEIIFTDSVGDFELEEGSGIYELHNGTLIMSGSGNLLSYSSDYGFQYFTNPIAVRDTVLNENSITFVSCNFDETNSASATLWDEVNGFGTTTSLPGSLCAEDLSYMTGQKNALIDYYTSNVYNAGSNYALLASGDLTGLGYIDENDDYDTQGNNPDIVMKKNGDVVFAYEDNLYGYAYNDQAWRQTITLDEGYSLAGFIAGGEYEYPLFQTENNKQIFAFAANADQTEYQVYRWTSAAGWQMEKTYSFASSTDLITTNLDKSKKNFDWAFWENAANELTVYRWNTAHAYETRTTRDLDCNAQCTFTLDVSKKGKIFFAWENAPEFYVAAWKPDTAIWEDASLIDTNDTAGSIVNTYVTTNKGQWIVEYLDGSTHYAKRWEPDTGWRATRQLEADATYFNPDNNKFYTVNLAADHSLTVSLFKLKNGTAFESSTVNEISSFESAVTFIFDDTIFLYYLTQDNERLLNDEAL